METLDGAADKNIPIITIIHKMKKEGGVNYKTLRKEARPCIEHCHWSSADWTAYFVDYENTSHLTNIVMLYEDSRRNNSLLFQMFFSVTYKYDWFVPDCKFPLRLFTTTCLCCVLKNIFSKSISKLFEHTEVEFNTFYFSIVEKNERTK